VTLFRDFGQYFARSHEFRRPGEKMQHFWKTSRFSKMRRENTIAVSKSATDAKSSRFPEKLKVFRKLIRFPKLLKLLLRRQHFIKMLLQALIALAEHANRDS